LEKRSITFAKNKYFDLANPKKITTSHDFFSLYLSTALMTVFLTTLSNMIGPSFLNCQASIIPWTNSAALILALAIKCAQRYVQGSHCKDKRSFSKLVSGVI